MLVVTLVDIDPIMPTTSFFYRLWFNGNKTLKHDLFEKDNNVMLVYFVYLEKDTFIEYCE